MKYIVMERHESYVIVLDEQGRFFKAANMDYSPGQTLTRVVPMEDIAVKKKKRAVFFVLILVFLALIGAGLWFFLFSGNERDLTVFRLYMGGEIAVSCDSENNVVKVEGFDEEGKAAAQVDFQNKNITEVSIELLEKAFSMGYVGKDSEIFMAIENEEDDDNPRLERAADSLEDYAEEKYDIEVEKSSWEDYLEDVSKEKYREHYHD